MKQFRFLFLTMAFCMSMGCMASVQNVSTTSAQDLLGDVNEDGAVNVTDVMMMVNDIIGKPASGYVREKADLNNDGTVTITDVMMLVNIIVSGETPEEGNPDAPPVEDDQANPGFPVLAPRR